MYFVHDPVFSEGTSLINFADLFTLIAFNFIYKGFENEEILMLYIC